MFSYFYTANREINELLADIEKLSFFSNMKHITIYGEEIEIVFHAPLNADDEAALTAVVLYQ